MADVDLTPSFISKVISNQTVQERFVQGGVSSAADSAGLGNEVATYVEEELTNNKHAAELFGSDPQTL